MSPILPDNIVLGQPPRIEGSPDVTWEEWLPVLGVTPEEVTVFEEARHLPRLLVNHGFAKSTSIIRKAKISKDQPPLVRDLGRPEMTEIKFGHKRVWIIVGELN